MCYYYIPSYPLYTDIYAAAILETAATRENCKPSQIKHAFRVVFTRDSDTNTDFFGKWMIFRSYDDIDEIWEKIRRAIAEDELQGCTRAKCSTMKYNPTKTGPGRTTIAEVSVYTKEHDIDIIGFKLIEIVKNDIKYKTSEATRSYQFTHAGCGKVTKRTIYWNDGKPSKECLDKPCPGPSYTKEDKWHLNEVRAPKPICFQKIHGWWRLQLEYEDLTRLWHLLKCIIESEEKNFGIIKMICPPKRDRKSRIEKPVFLVYTNCDNKHSVGEKLKKIIKEDVSVKRDLRGDEPVEMDYIVKPLNHTEQ